MDEKETYPSNIPSIPETIEPGITIPIYDDTGTSITPNDQSPQKLGSYRSKAGRFSNKFSNILPSISAKLHHSSSKKSLPHEKDSGNVNLHSGNSDTSVSSLSTRHISNNNNADSINKEKVNVVPISGVPYGTTVRISNEHDRLVKFPSASPSKNQSSISTNITNTSSTTKKTNNNNNIIATDQLQPSINNGLQQQISRSRNNTMASQYTSLSLHPYNSAGTGNLWPTTSALSNAQQPYHQHNSSYDLNIANNGTAQNPASGLTPSLEYGANGYGSSYFNVPLMKSTTNYDTSDSYNNNNNMNNTNFGVPTNNNNNTSNNLNGQSDPSIWSPDAVARKRSQSMATQVHPDAYYVQQPQSAMVQNAESTAQLQVPYGQMDQYHYSNHNSSSGNYSNQMVDVPFRLSPLLMDDIDPRSISWVTTNNTVPPINQISSLLPTNAIALTNIYPLQQTEPQYINAVNLTSTAIASLCSNFGNVISVRTLRDLNIALIEFDSVDAARITLESLQGKDISILGYPSLISYAKILPLYHQAQNTKGHNAPRSLLQDQLVNGSIVFHQQGSTQIPLLQSQLKDTIRMSPQKAQQQTQQPQPSQQTVMFQGLTNNANGTQITLPIENEICPFPLPPPSIQTQNAMLKTIMNDFKVNHDINKTSHILIRALNIKETVDLSDFGPTPEPLSTRQFQTPKLREIRKAIDSNSLSDIEIEQLGMIMLDELPELSFDYLGNTIVQKIYDRSSDIIRDIILRKISKYLTSLGIHKSGTWVCQKMIKLAHNPRALWLVTEGIKDYCTALFNDQFGNYVIQEVLKFGVPWNNFIFESILGNFWIICKNKYGARAIRACLEATAIITTEQTLIISAMIVACGEYLITDNNGTLLITWLLDTCQFDEKYLSLTRKIVGNIAVLCCHKLGSLTVLKILNSRGNDECRKLILDEIFGDNVPEEGNKDETLVKILSDSSYGPTFMHKLLTSRLLDDDVKTSVVERIRRVILENNIPQQNHKLMEEVGLVSVNTSGNQDRSPLKHNRTSGLQHLSHVTSNSNHNDGSRRMRGMSASSVRSGGIPGINIQSMTPVAANGNNNNNNNNNNNMNDEMYIQYDPNTNNKNNLNIPFNELSLNRTISSDATDVYSNNNYSQNNMRLNNYGF
ncbi:hypothetical protein C6P45_001997 [Maudiozyma exigua]|uniref:PUM-HD domain-containing protein n=1 Tax=Maudiozyma exigua TaxID=34358 RepID=A0A9P6WFP5_MAUEX|nr:hypothetical protein C6P45_001997 [Kazachstania exigua]